MPYFSKGLTFSRHLIFKAGPLFPSPTPKPGRILKQLMTALNPLDSSLLCLLGVRLWYTSQACYPLRPGKDSGLTLLSPEDFNPCRVGALANGNYKVSPKKMKKKKKIFSDLEIVGFCFSLRLVNNFFQGGRFSDPADGSQTAWSPTIANCWVCSNCQSSRVALESTKQLWRAHCTRSFLFFLLSAMKQQH